MSLRHFFISLILFIGVTSKFYSNSIRTPIFRRENSWIFLQQMYLSQGNLNVQISLNFESQNKNEGALYELQIIAIPEQIWKISKQIKCERAIYPVDQLMQINEKQSAFNIFLSPSNQYKYSVRSEIQINKSQNYYFVLRDCSKNIINAGYGRETKINVQMDIRNNNSHISKNQKHYSWVLPVLLLFSFVMLRFIKIDKEQEENWFKFILKFSIYTNIFSYSIKLLAFIIYSNYGVVSTFLQVCYLLLHSSSDSIVTVLLMLLSFGWTVTFNNTRDFDLYVPLACMLGLITIIMTMLTKINDGQHDKYHMYDSIPTYILIGFKVIGIIVFIVGLFQFYMQKLTAKIKIYFYQLSIIGTIYLLILPLGFVLIGYIDAVHRKQMMFFGIQIGRVACDFALMILCTMKNSSYRKIINQSFMEKGQKYF